MDHIRFILPQANASRGEGVEFSAAAVVAAINDVLRRQGFPLEQAEAISFHHRQARIKVSHGAIAGRIQQQSDHIIDDVNSLLRQRFPTQVNVLDALTTRFG